MLAAFLSAFSLNVHAQSGFPTPLIGNFAQQRDDLNFQRYIDGGFDGLVVYNVLVEQKNKQKPAFCPPTGFDTSAKIAIQLIDEFVKANPLTSDTDKKLPTLFALYLALENKYPCK